MEEHLASLGLAAAPPPKRAPTPLKPVVRKVPKEATKAAPKKVQSVQKQIQRRDLGPQKPKRSLANETNATPTATAPASTEPKKKKGKKRKRQKDDPPPSIPTPQSPPRPSKAKRTGPPSALSKLTARLTGGRFRYLNEMLYTSTSEHALAEFSANPELFEAYHEGFRHQTVSWPTHPLDTFIAILSEQATQLVNKSKGKSAKGGGELVVGDFGCGEGRLGQTLAQLPVPVTVHSFDLVSPNKWVTACDMAHTNLPSGSLDYAVFCLSLMGTNIPDFLREANRTLRVGGVLLVAEVESRIDSAQDFLATLQQFGFGKPKELQRNKIFLSFSLTKVRDVTSVNVSGEILKPCIYKRR